MALHNYALHNPDQLALVSADLLYLSH